MILKHRGRGGTGRPPNLEKQVEEDLIAENQRLRAENEYLKNLQALVLEDEQHQHKKTQVIAKLGLKFSLIDLLSIAQIPRATYYYHGKRQNQPDKYSTQKAEITAIFHENKGRYGYRRITSDLDNRGYVINHKTVQRLMKRLGIVCRVRMKKYRSYEPANKKSIGKRGKFAARK